MKTFGAERLREGSGMVDVAGGKGYISFQLQCTGHDIPTTLIEPRLAKLNKKQKKYQRPSSFIVCVSCVSCCMCGVIMRMRDACC